MELEVTESLTPDTGYAAFKKARSGEASAAAEPAAEKVTQSEEDMTVSAAEPVAAETSLQESEPVSQTVEDQVRELRKAGRHAKANELERKAAADEARKESAAELAQLRKELEGLRARPAEPKREEVKAEPAKADTDKRPSMTDPKYQGEDGFDKYIEDVADWKADQRFKSHRQQEETQRSHQTLQEKVSKVFETGRQAKPDFESVVSQAKFNTDVLREGLSKLDNIGDVLYKLGSQPAEVARIQSMAPIEQYAELVYVSRSLKASPAVSAAPPVALKPAVSRVSAPPRVLSGADTSEAKSTAEARDYDEYKRIRRRAS
jgi:chromosome segregation ATPase